MFERTPDSLELCRALVLYSTYMSTLLQSCHRNNNKKRKEIQIKHPVTLLTHLGYYLFLCSSHFHFREIMSSKRKREAKDDVGEAVGGKKEKGLLADFCFFLHPAALSKVRRSIFEKQISANRGRLLPKLEDASEEGGTVTVLIDDSLADRDKVRSIAEKVGRENPSVNIQCVGLSWLSKCLEEREVAPLEGFAIRSTPAAKPPKTSAGGSDGAADEQDDKDKPDDAEAPSSSSTKGAPSSYIERNKHKFVCARSSDNKLDENLNKHITDQLEKLAAAYKSSNDTWRCCS